MKVEDFYNEISKEYTDMLDRAVPKYREMLSTILHAIPSELKPRRILELGCGTGNLTELIIVRYPEVELVVVDISAEILNECRQRFNSIGNITYHKNDFNNLDYNFGEFDLILSSIAIHHINDNDKEILFNKLFAYLRPEGTFIYADQCKGITDEIYEKHLASWKNEAFKLGSSEEDWAIWMDHQNKHDFHATIELQLQILKDASFKSIDVLWKNLLWTVFYAEK